MIAAGISNHCAATRYCHALCVKGSMNAALQVTINTASINVRCIHLAEEARRLHSQSPVSGPTVVSLVL